MGFFLNNKMGITPQGDLQSDTLIDSIIELDEDLTTFKNEMSSTASGNLITQNNEPENTGSLWIDTSEN